MATHVKNTEDFKTQIKKVDTQTLVLLEFSAKWCAACSLIEPEVEKIAKDNPIVKCFAIDVDDCEDIATEYNVVALPTIHFVKDGNILESIVGAKKSALKNALSKLHPEGMLEENIIEKDDKKDSKEKDAKKVSSEKDVKELSNQKDKKLTDEKHKSLIDDLLEMAAALPESKKKDSKEKTTEETNKKVSESDKPEEATKKDPKQNTKEENKKKDFKEEKSEQEKTKKKEEIIKPLEIPTEKEDIQKEI
ncbi:unnamed protein product [Brassicogethes aeneus]|uniref:Thioredoxin domain-containing protein n=1 Tax=Brassicogethes aeneus TaxID=1431903 RepID=A0A9P0ART0_BRAAE|nr:unnamed protein product [Brassicogethes aeneus]